MLKHIFLLSLLFILISCQEKKQSSPSPISLQDSSSTKVVDSNLTNDVPVLVNDQIQDSLIFQLDIQPTEGDPSPWTDVAFENYNREFFIPLKNNIPINLDQRPKAKAIHVFVALCDVRYQGIAATPLRMADGQKPQTNLYWGAGYGVKNYFDHYSHDWKLVKTESSMPKAVLDLDAKLILERCIFKHQRKDIYLVADAYDGRCIRETSVNFIQAAAGQQPQYAELDSLVLPIGGEAALVAYIGHQGLMDFQLSQFEEGRLQCPESKNQQVKPIIALACYSKEYLQKIMQCAQVDPLIWTKSLIGPEAYILHDALEAWLAEGEKSEILDAGLKAIVKYQKYSYKAAQTILTTDF